jgi:putative transposase
MKGHRERKPTRLQDYDYSRPGAYFITACAKNRASLFETSDARLAVESAWHSIPDMFANVELDEFVVMPNHVHGILWITEEGAYRIHPGTWKTIPDCRDDRPAIPAGPIPSGNRKIETLSNFLGAFKTLAATRVNKLRGVIGMPVWQKSFHGRIIRNDRELKRIQEYIRNNPAHWVADRDNPVSPEFGPLAKSMDAYWKDIFDFHA